MWKWFETEYQKSAGVKAGFKKLSHPLSALELPQQLDFYFFQY